MQHQALSSSASSIRFRSRRNLQISHSETEKDSAEPKSRRSGVADSNFKVNSSKSKVND